MTSLRIFGAGGHGKVAAEIAELNGYQHIEFYDAKYPELQQLAAWSVVGKGDDLNPAQLAEQPCFVAIGNNRIRARIFDQLRAQGANLVSLLHPAATVSRYASVGAGSLVCAGASINPYAHIGDNCIVNTNASVDHDCQISDHVHIAPGCNLAGDVQVGEGSFLGIGSAILPGKQLGEWVTLGAGSTLVENLPAKVLAYGCPAKIK